MDRIVVRHAEPGDAAAIRDIYAQPNAYAGTLQLPFPSEKMWETRMGNIPENVYSFVGLIEDRIVGNLGFEIYKNPRRRHAGSFRMGVHDEFLRRGMGSALMEALLDLADNWLNIHRIEISVYTDNKAAIALYEKFGFKTEGLAQHYAFRNGQYVDVNYMARINDA